MNDFTMITKYGTWVVNAYHCGDHSPGVHIDAMVCVMPVASTDVNPEHRDDLRNLAIGDYKAASGWRVGNWPVLAWFTDEWKLMPNSEQL